MTQPFTQSPDPAQLFAEIQQGVKEESPTSTQSQTQDARHEQAVPYERFQQVNSRAQEAERKYVELLERTARQEAAAQGQSYSQVQQAGQTAARQAQELLTPEEIEYFSTNALTDPGNSYRQLTQLIYERGVKTETERVKNELRQEFGQVASQFATQIAPLALNTYKAQNLTGIYSQAAGEFDALVAQEVQVNPGVVNNPQALNTLRSLALARVVESGKFQTSTTPALPYSEAPGSFNPFPTPQGPQTDARAVELGRLLGLPENVIRTTDTVFQKNGVYRNEF